jgi:glycosyltransferase involved in cell wall biosynthesis
MGHWSDPSSERFDPVEEEEPWLRVLILSTGLFPIPPDGGGAVERHVYNLVLGLRRNNVDVDIVGQSNQENSDLAAAAVRFHCLLRIPFRFETSFYGWLLNFICGAFLTVGTILSMKDRARFDVVHGHDVLSTLIVAKFRWLLFPRAKIVFTMHGYALSFGDIPYRGTKRLVVLCLVSLFGALCRTADSIVVFTMDQFRRVLRSHHLPPNRLAIVPQVVSFPNRINSFPLLELQKKLPGVSSDFCLFVGRLSPLKGVQDLILALSNIDTKCVIVGGGPYELALREYTHSLSLDHKVWFTGALKHTLVDQLYERAYVAVHPSYAEGFPLVVLEAMSHGLPVIASDIPGMRDAVIDGWNGFLYKPGDVPALQSHIRTIVKDASLRDQFAKNAKRYVREKFWPDKIGKAMTSVYMQTIGDT